MEYYNTYARGEYNSEIAFINTKNSIIKKEIFYVEFEDDRKTGMYLDNNNYLKNLYFPLKIKQNEECFLKRSNGLIKKVTPAIQYFTLIKIIKDEQNPQIEGKIMIWKFGLNIYKNIQDFISNNSNKYFDKTFKIIIKKHYGFPNFDNCHFTNNEVIIFDTLNIESQLNFKTINITSIERKEKLQKLNEVNSVVTKLEEIILDSIDGKDWSDCRSTVKGFTQKKLYNWYLEECSKASILPDSTIQEIFY